MDLLNLVHHTVDDLSPALPFLLEIGHGAAKKIGENTVGKVSELASKLWGCIYPRAVSERPALIEAAQDLASNPEDIDAQGALRIQLRKLLESNTELQSELQSIFGSVVVQQSSVAASGSGAIAIGGSVSGSSLTTNVDI